MKNIFLTFSTIFFLTLVACGSTPKEISDPPVVEEEVVEDVPEEVIVEDDAPEEIVEEPKVRIDLSPAITAMQRTEEVEVARLLPEQWAEIEETFNSAQNSNDQFDSEMATSQRDETIRLANLAYEEAIKLLIQEYLSILDQLVLANKEIKADLFFPEDASVAFKQKEAASSSLNTINFSDSRRQYWAARESLETLLESTNENIEWLNILQNNIEQSLEDAEDAEAHLWSPDELKVVTDLYYEGLSHFSNYELAESETMLLMARAKGRELATLATNRRELARIDSIMNAVAGSLADVSTQSSTDPLTNQKIDPFPVTKEELYADVELVSPSELEAFSIYVPEDSKLRLPGLSEPATATPSEDVTDQTGPAPLLFPSKEKIEENDINSLSLVSPGVLVLGADETASNPLEEAKIYWKNGVQARNDQDYKLAEEYFVQAQAYINEYQSNSRNNTYTVESGDSLWRIAGQQYKEPFFWPKIWRSNRDKIANPDLIFPDQDFVIPTN